LIRCVVHPKRLSREQARILTDAGRRPGAIAISAITQIFEELEANPSLHILPLTIDIAKESSLLGPTLRDTSDCVIVATARVHGLRLLTSDQRIIESKVVSVVD